MSEQNMPKGNPGTQGSDGKQKAGGLISGIMAILAELLIVAHVFSGVFYFSLKSDLFGLGEKFRPTLQTHPILRLALPHAQSGDEAQNLSKATIETAATTQAAANETELAAIARQKAELEALQQQVSESAARGDTTGFKAFYEKLDPKTAAAIYESIQAAAAADGQAKLAARPFELMDRKKAAGVLKELWSKDKDLLISIVDANKSQTLAEILAEMDATLAADITRSLADYRRAKAESVQGTATSP